MADDGVQRLRAAERTLIAFGPQALSYNKDTFDHLRSTLANKSELDWILSALQTLPRIWKQWTEKDATLKSGLPSASLGSFVEALDTGRADLDWSRLPNVVLTPLVVVQHLLQYIKYLDVTGRAVGIKQRKSGVETHVVGLCPGLLSAAAVACSTSEDDLRQYGSVAIRLAMLIGGIVDTYDAESYLGPSQSLAVTWNSIGEEAAFTHVIGEHHDAYISVVYDENRVTVTATEEATEQLQVQLRAHGLNVKPVSLFGRFHSPCHQERLQALSAWCNEHDSFRFPPAPESFWPYSSKSPQSFTESVLGAILCDRADWFMTLRKVCTSHVESLVLCIGHEKCVPPSLQRSLGVKHFINASEVLEGQAQNFTAQLPLPTVPPPRLRASEDDIAVVGMACKFANADSLDELWKVLLSGKSQHQELSEDRFKINTPFRTSMTKKQKWYANLLRDHDSFDHAFFKKSPREAQSMDPQQRLFLQIAYQALEQAGYFSHKNPEVHVGCYVGCCSQDYQTNVACHDPNAYTATGNLSSFIAGKVSWQFGWTGPAMVIDTACSSSAVAIHAACQAIISGDCKQALAGGSLVMTSPLWWHNLSGASFLNTTGNCKPFDHSGDGYCRGEGVAGVVLKKMSDAVADGDQIFGCIAASAVLQNENRTPIVVPNVPSLSTLFTNVLRRAGLDPQDISVAEAHGTGTPVGDPAEWGSLRQVLGGRKIRQNQLTVGSVKGHIGHTECTSGAAALLKVLLMMHYGRIPPQASFQRLSPKLQSSPDDMMQVLTTTKDWDSAFRAALINNYGASGSNASMIVTQPFSNALDRGSRLSHFSGLDHPFWISGPTEPDVRRNAACLLDWLRSQENAISLADLSFNLSRRSNRTFDTALSFSANTLGTVLTHLQSIVNGDSSEIITSSSSSRPVVLCFGGQISTSIGLDRAVYERFAVLRRHIDHCDAVMRSLNLGTVFPYIFEKNPMEDVVRIQASLFALQYACAQSWIDSGVEVAAAVGHSFGELTALCICGVLSLPDAIQVVVRRATLIRDEWGPERGAMMAIEADLNSVQDILQTASEMAEAEGVTPATIACYNSPTSFTVAGSEMAVGLVYEVIQQSSSPQVRSKKLNISNAFHSTLIEPLIGGLQKVMNGIAIRKPQIPLIHSTDTERLIDTNFIARHLRQPVHFYSAVQRAAAKYPQAVFLEAGSNSTITNMASRALGSPKDVLFQPVNITSSNAESNICAVTQAVRKAGLFVNYWGHSRCQTYHYRNLLLPPYQFAKSRHWLDLKSLPDNFAQASNHSPALEQDLSLKMWTFLGYQDRERSLARFRIKTETEQYNSLLVGHIIAEEAPICPATLQLDLVVEAVRDLHPDLVTKEYRPIISHVENQAPICKDSGRTVFLDLTVAGRKEHSWDWRMYSVNSSGSASTTHVTGQAALRRADEKDYQLDFARYERLVSHSRCKQLLEDQSPDDMIYGRNIYRAFKDVVDYGEIYRGVQKLVGKGFESAGRVTRAYSGDTWFDGIMSDCFCQVGGVYVNCMTDRPHSSLYIANAIEQWVRSPRTPIDTTTSSWDVFATHQKVSEKSYCTDIFVFDSSTGILREVILGIHYAEVPKASMRRLLSRNTPEPLQASATAAGEVKSVIATPRTTQAVKIPIDGARVTPATTLAAHKSDSSRHVATRLKEIIAELCGLEVKLIQDDAELADLGVDSLMAMELCKEIEIAFECEIGEDERGDIIDLPGLVACVKMHTAATPSEDSADESSNLSSSGSTSTRPSSVVDSDSDVEPKVTVRIAPSNDGIVSDATWLDAFKEMNQTVDDGIARCGFGDYLSGANAKQTELCVVMILEAFAQLGCDLKGIQEGEITPMIPHVPSQEHLVNYCYRILDVEGGLILRHGGSWRRTSVSVPAEKSEILLQRLHAQYPDHKDATQLAYFCGTRYADVFQGKDSGVKMMFGTEEGKDLVSKLYGNWPLNYMYYQKMASFFEKVASRVPAGVAPLRILEMGGGTAGTTKVLLPRLAKLNLPIEYTFTDLSPAFCAQARKRFKDYAFVKYRAHDIEKPAPDDLIGSQHVVIASNAVHATHDLEQSTRHIKQFLRDDGILLMLEMTSPVCFIDIIFGLFEGWWMFNDDREHAVCHEKRWQRIMQSTGYGHVEWTNGARPEHRIEKLVMGMASGSRYAQANQMSEKIMPCRGADLIAREAVIENYVRKYTESWELPVTTGDDVRSATPAGNTVLVTGATGSLGAHIVAHAASLPHVARVVCINRISRDDPLQRQRCSFTERGIAIDPTALSKLTVLAANTTLPCFGLPQTTYDALIGNVTHICHNAWPMSATRAVEEFEAQFQVMRNLVDLATATTVATRSIVGFQLISSIAVVGHYPLWTGNALVPEERMTVDSILPNGYGDAKYICERMLDETLHRLPSRFRPMVVRPGQIAGSVRSGHWNTHEHLSFLVKSCQTLRAIPDFEGVASWTPVEDAAGTCVDLLLSPGERAPHPIYHIDNPVRQSWREMLVVWAEALGIPLENMIPFEEWIERVRLFKGKVSENPAIKLVNFLDGNFVRMSCGGLLMDTAKTCGHSKTLASLGPVSEDVVKRYFRSWVERGWLAES